eukprot:4681268-Pyramimonas_sp.AAC.1
MEMIWVEAEAAPCVVDVGCRPHGSDGYFKDIAQPCIGYDQLSVMADLILHGRAPNTDNI